MSQLPTGTVTFLFTDVEGSTRLLHEEGSERYGALLVEHHHVCRAAWAAFGGVEVDTAGDAFFVAFPTAAGAAGAAALAQRGLGELGLAVRMGLHTGEVTVNETGYVGIEVHRAARIAAAGHGGQVLVSASTAAHMSEGALVSLGRHRFKDFDEPVEVFQLGDGVFPQLKTIANTNLPTPPSSFVGRDKELLRAADLLPDTRILTVVGPGGAGKTRFALELATRAREERFSDYRDGVFWVPLAALRDPALVLDSVAKVLGASGDLTAYIGERRLLLLLDNLEQVLDVAPELSDLLSACPNLTLLCTSRELLGIAGERAFELPPLAGDEGVALFCERSGARPSPAIAELCRRLDGLPLAIELAAARARLLSVAQILERLSGRLDLFRSGADSDPRQATLRATIAWSHELLDLDEQLLFARLAVFAGGCTFEAAEAVCEADLDTMQSLLDKSLLRRSDDDGEPRFWMLETIREFALERLEESGEAEALRLAHTDWFSALADPPDGNLYSASTSRTDLLERELDNFRAVLEYRIEREDSTGALALACWLFVLWEMRDRLVEGDRWLDRALSLPGEQTPGRGLALASRAALAYHLSRNDKAYELASSGVEVLRETGSDAELAQALHVLSWTLGDTDMVASVATAEEALESARRSGSQATVRTVLHRLGELERDRGESDRAVSRLEEALAISRDLGHASFVVAILHSLGDVELYRGDDPAAWQRYVEAATLGVVERVPGQVGLCLGGLAAVAARRGESELAGRLWAALETWEQERGVMLHPHERARYEEAVAGLESAAEAALTMEQAVALAQEHTPMGGG